MLLEKQKWRIILITSWNIQILLLTQITKLMPAINKVHVHVSVSIYLSMPRMKAYLRRLW